MVKKQTIENSLEIFRDRKIMTINEFIPLIRCSIPTIRLYLKRWEVLRSYNKNGIYYVLPDIPRFNKYGIWQYKEVYFSKHGDLTKTIIGVIDRSKNGLDALEINNILGIDARTFLSNIRKNDQIWREKYEGRYIYFSRNKLTYQSQKENQLGLDTVLSDALGILVLVEKVKAPDLDEKAISQRLKKQGVNVSSNSITQFFKLHGIKKNSEFDIITKIRTLLDRSINELKAVVYFREPPPVKFRPEQKNCPFCGKALQVYRTDPKRKITTLHIGSLMAHHTLLYCNNCDNPIIYRSQELSGLVPQYSNFGYDVLYFIGKAIFQRHKTATEVVKELEQTNVHISSSEVLFLAKKFIIYLALIQHESIDAINDCMKFNGGYILHLDGMCDGNSPHLISTIDELSRLVLANVKIPTENAKQIIPMLKEVKKRHGNPLAIVSDMGRAMIDAIEQVFHGILCFICHFHFLRDIGKDLLEKEYRVIRNTLKKYGISNQLRYRLRQYFQDIKQDNGWQQIKGLIQSPQLSEKSNNTTLKIRCYVLMIWALDGKNHGNGYGFPFDRPHVEFYQRLCRMYETIDHILKTAVNIDSESNKIAGKILNDLQPLMPDDICKQASIYFDEKVTVFEKLRNAMRIALASSNKGLNDNGEHIDIKTIEQNVKKIRSWLINKDDYPPNDDYQKVIKSRWIGNKYWEKLFADPIAVETPNGIITIQPQRTNNIIEQFFRDIRRDYGRRTGKSTMCKKLQTMLVDTPLVKNLDNPEYMKIILNGKSSLEERFAEIEDRLVREKLLEAQQMDVEKIPPEIKKLIRTKNIPHLCIELLKN